MNNITEIQMGGGLFVPPELCLGVYFSYILPCDFDLEAIRADVETPSFGSPVIVEFKFGGNIERIEIDSSFHRSVKSGLDIKLKKDTGLHVEIIGIGSVIPGGGLRITLSKKGEANNA